MGEDVKVFSVNIVKELAEGVVRGVAGPVEVLFRDVAGEEALGEVGGSHTLVARAAGGAGAEEAG